MSSAKELARQGAHRLYREAEHGPAPPEEISDGAAPSGAGCNYIKDVARTTVEPLAQRVEGACVVGGIEGAREGEATLVR
jgi:hypothetical protein